MERRWLALGLLLAGAAAWMAYLAVYQVDDAFIVYRYATNLAHGNGLVFNPGERVEGVTCFLWAVVLAPAAALGLQLPRVVPLLTGIAGLATLAALPGLAARLDGRERWDLGDLAAPALLAVLPGFALWSGGALETVPFALLVTLMLRFHLEEKERGRGPRSAVPAAISMLVRPEAPLLAGVLVLDRVFGWTATSDATLRTRAVAAARWVAIVFGALASFLIFRRVYYGDWLPNTYYAKTGAGLAVQLANGWSYLQGFLAALVSATLTPPIARWTFGGELVLGLLVWGWFSTRRRGAVLLVLALFGAVVLEGGDWMVGWRFFVPALPALAALATCAVRTAWRARRPYGLACALAGVAGAAAWTVQTLELRNDGQGLIVNAAGYRHAHLAVAAWLRTHARPDDTVALMDVGVIGYTNPELRVIDISGLTDRAVAHAPGGFLEKRFPPQAILARDPRFFVLVPDFPIDDSILALPEFQRRYRLVLQRNHRFNWRPPSRYVLSLFERVEPSPTR